VPNAYDLSSRTAVVTGGAQALAAPSPLASCPLQALTRRAPPRALQPNPRMQPTGRGRLWAPFGLGYTSYAAVARTGPAT
jgi:hypothetical protein